MSVRRLSSNQDFNGRRAGNSEKQSRPIDRRWHPAGSQDHGLAEIFGGDRPQAGAEGYRNFWTREKPDSFSTPIIRNN